MNLYGQPEIPLNTFVLDTLPIVCQWIAHRFMLFADTLDNQSILFWYDDATADPVTWHHDWVASAGLHIVATHVEIVTDAALRGEFPSGLMVSILTWEVRLKRTRYSL